MKIDTNIPLVVPGKTPVKVEKDKATGLPLDYISANGLASKVFSKTSIDLVEPADHRAVEGKESSRMAGLISGSANGSQARP